MELDFMNLNLQYISIVLVVRKWLLVCFLVGQIFLINAKLLLFVSSLDFMNKFMHQMCFMWITAFIIEILKKKCS